MLRQKPTQKPFIFTVYLMNTFSDICTIVELKELSWLRKDMEKTSEAANLVFQWIFVLNLVLPCEYR